MGQRQDFAGTPSPLPSWDLHCSPLILETSDSPFDPRLGGRPYFIDRAWSLLKAEAAIIVEVRLSALVNTQRRCVTLPERQDSVRFLRQRPCSFPVLVRSAPMELSSKAPGRHQTTGWNRDVWAMIGSFGVDFYAVGAQRHNGASNHGIRGA